MSEKTKIAGLSIFKRLGLFRLSALLTENKIRILCYHRFGAGHVIPQYFEKQIIYLKKSFNIIDLQFYLDCLAERTQQPSKAVLLTVDDGYQDFYTVAFPILRKYNVPATVFLTADFIDGRIWLWHDFLNFAIRNTSIKKYRVNGRVFDLTNGGGKAELKLFLDHVCTSVTTAERDAVIAQVLEELGVGVTDHLPQEYAALTWGQISEMSKSRISYGAHTCSHPILTRIGPQEALREIRESKHRIEERIQKAVPAFCYPNGKEDDLNENIKTMVRECGFACGMSMIYGMNDCHSDPYELRRMADRESFIHFVHDVSGFGELRRSLRRMVKDS